MSSEVETSPGEPAAKSLSVEEMQALEEERRMLAPVLPPGAVVLSESEPIAYYLDNVVSDEEVEHLIATASSQLGRARVSDTVASQGTKHPGGESKTRTNSVAWLTGFGDAILEGLEDKICDIVSCRPENTEEFQVIHYEVSQEYRPHYDSYDMLNEHGRLNTVRGGNRLITVLLYLSDVDEGGGTSFPNLGITVAPKKGRMLCFYNTRPVTGPGFFPDGPHQAYVPEPNSLHAGDPVIKGTKWAVNKWIRQRAMKPVRPRRLPAAGDPTEEVDAGMRGLSMDGGAA